jgi:hypothetical protein
LTILIAKRRILSVNTVITNPFLVEDGLQWLPNTHLGVLYAREEFANVKGCKI